MILWKAHIWRSFSENRLTCPNNGRCSGARSSLRVRFKRNTLRSPWRVAWWAGARWCRACAGRGRRYAGGKPPPSAKALERFSLLLHSGNCFYRPRRPVHGIPGPRAAESPGRRRTRCPSRRTRSCAGRRRRCRTRAAARSAARGAAPRCAGTGRRSCRTTRAGRAARAASRPPLPRGASWAR